MDKYLKVFYNEIYTASRAFYTHLRINKEAIEDKKVYFAINKDAEFWNFFNRALVDCFYIATGRLFDDDTRSFTASRFIKICKNNIELFSLSSLRERKIKSSANSAEWIDEYMGRASSITSSDFDKLNTEVVRAKEKYAVCKKIRDKLIAHSDEKAVFSTEEMPGATNEDIKSILFSLYQVYKVVLQYYQDGMPSAVGDHVFKEEEYVTKDVAALIGKLVVARNSA